MKGFAMMIGHSETWHWCTEIDLVYCTVVFILGESAFLLIVYIDEQFTSFVVMHNAIVTLQHCHIIGMSRGSFNVPFINHEVTVKTNHHFYKMAHC